MNCKSLFLFCALISCSFPLYAQEGSPLNFRFETRGDYQRDYVDGDLVDGDTGFKGKYLNIIMTGDLTKDISYVYRQRLNKMHGSSSFFDATDFLYLDWRAAERLTLSAGKQVVGIGGYEYDRAPINLYFCSEFWNMIPCYAWGASAAYAVNGGKDKLVFQVCESPFRSYARNSDVYGYNLMWVGSHGRLSTLWSVNMIEWDKGKYINYIALGNEVKLTDQVGLQLDFMNRAVSHQTFLLKDCSVMAELSYRPTDKVNVFAKCTYDVNNTDNAGDYCVLPGTEITRLGGGVEYFPLGDDHLRLHANYCYSFGCNGNPDGVMADKQSIVDIGLTWRVDWKVGSKK